MKGKRFVDKLVELCIEHEAVITVGKTGQDKEPCIAIKVDGFWFDYKRVDKMGAQQAYEHD